ncbi:SMP-30/gluconolactonase/LRE family protein [Ramlibacter sp. PS4R-6]|uniref:SMP-30/gluconolactonase/LRE family protein n=1 Tax=Ramlibacter sp. PS4R-6 TaxID=3133438 RepID=UPI0030995407
MFRQLHVAAVALGLCCASFIAGAQTGFRPGPIFGAEAKLDPVFSGGFFLEGPAVAEDGTVFFSDITITAQSSAQAGHVWRYDPRTGKTVIFRSPSGMNNGNRFDEDGSLVSALGADFGCRCVIRTDMKTGKSSILAGLFNGRPLNSPNDLVIDRQRRIYFTDPRYYGHESVEQPVAGVYRIDPGAPARLVIADAGKPNGIAISPDQRTLYVSSIGPPATAQMASNLPAAMNWNAVYAYPLGADGSVGPRQTLVDYWGRRTGIDGMTVDTEGNIYAARVSAVPQDRGVVVFSPTGEELAFVPMADNPTNVAFGRGGDRRKLYITARANLFRIDVLKDGFHPFEK